MPKILASKKLKKLAIIIFVLFAAVFAVQAVKIFYRGAYPVKYLNIIKAEAAKNDLPLELVLAVCYTESGFRPNAVSSVGARGVMQLTEETFNWVKTKLEPDADTVYDDMFNPEINIKYGCKLLRLLFDEFGSQNNVLAAYHAGWGSVKKWLASDEHSAGGRLTNIPFKDTKMYVEKVAQVTVLYKKLYS